MSSSLPNKVRPTPEGNPVSNQPFVGGPSRLVIEGPQGKPMIFDSHGFLVDSGGQLNALEKGYYNARVEGTPQAMKRWAEAYKKADPDGIYAGQQVYASECLYQTGTADCGKGSDLWMVVAQMSGAAVMGTGLERLEKGVAWKGRAIHNNEGVKDARSIAGSKTIGLSSKENWANPKTLKEHFIDHGMDFGAKNMEDYAKKAADFFQSSQKEKYPTKIDEMGIIRIYDPDKNILGSYTSQGKTKTFYKPRRKSPDFPRGHPEKTNLDYWKKQKGREI